MNEIIQARKAKKMSQQRLALDSGVPRWRITILEMKYDAAKTSEIRAMKAAIRKYKK